MRSSQIVPCAFLLAPLRHRCTCAIQNGYVANKRRRLVHYSTFNTDVLQHQPFLVSEAGLTILLQSTAPSALSLRSGSVCAPLLRGKMLPAGRGRFLRPYGAELMHAHSPPRTRQARTHTHARAQRQSLVFC